MSILECAWKPNWEETKRHFIDWWHREGLVVTMWGAPGRPRLDVPCPERLATVEETFTNIDWRVRKNHYELTRGTLPFDNLPMADTNMGPGSLATFIGSEPRFTPETVWFEPTIQEVDEPESLPPLRFDPQNRWWRLNEALLRKSKELAGNYYLVGCPDLVENLDTLAALRETQTLLCDMIERPEWVREKLKEINQVWFEAYRRIYDITKLSDGSSSFCAFHLWGPGKTAKVQCDSSAMFSPAMFRDFVMPSLTEQCEWLDNSLYHLDGSQALCHLDSLLEIDALDAVQWNPEPGIEEPGSPHWYDLNRRILGAGKSVQIAGVHPREVVPLLDAIGGKGVYIAIHSLDEREAEKLLIQVEQFR